MWALNPRKQTVDTLVHEFLQKEPDLEYGGITGPIVNAVAAFCSGQWYREKTINIDSLGQGLSDSGWEIGYRTGSMSTSMLMVARTLNSLMVVSRIEGADRRKLEWFIFRKNRGRT